MKKLYIILFIVFIITDIVVFLLFTKGHQIPKAVKSKLISKSLVEQTRFLAKTSDSLKSLSSKTVFVYDTTIIKNNLPELTNIDFVLLNSSAIKDSVNSLGHISYLQLAGIYEKSDTITTNWFIKSGILSHKLNKIIYQTNEKSIFKYNRTSKGWIGGISRVFWIDNLGVK